MILVLVVMVLLVACSGARGKESRPPQSKKAETCNVDAGGADAPASSYYQIGTCPEEESEP